MKEANIGRVSNTKQTLVWCIIS